MTAPDATPSPGKNPLDTPETRAAVEQHVRWFNCDRDDWEGAVTAILAALAPHVAAAQRATFRAGVEAAAGMCERRAETLWKRESFLEEQCAIFAEGMARDVRALPVPAGFAAPERGVGP